jgi:hypothetical protein
MAFPLASIEDVLRFEVAMENPKGMPKVHASGDDDEDVVRRVALRTEARSVTITALVLSSGEGT